jgi:hypothetical protein
MSEIKTIPIPINKIKYSKSWHSFSDPYNQIQNYLFELNIIMDNDEKKSFIKLESDKHCNLIFIKDQIKYNKIKKFNLCVKKIPDEYSLNYQMKGNINQDLTFYTQTNEDLFIEFSQNSNGFTNCNCTFTGIDFNKICISPPN